MFYERILIFIKMLYKSKKALKVLSILFIISSKKILVQRLRKSLIINNLTRYFGLNSLIYLLCTTKALGRRECLCCYLFPLVDKGRNYVHVHELRLVGRDRGD